MEDGVVGRMGGSRLVGRRGGRGLLALQTQLLFTWGSLVGAEALPTSVSAPCHCSLPRASGLPAIPPRVPEETICEWL